MNIILQIYLCACVFLQDTFLEVERKIRVHISNHYVAHLKLIQYYMSITSQ